MMSQAMVEAAGEEWGFNCGPGALCAVLGMTPAELRPHLLDFEAKGYTNPTLMQGILLQLHVDHQLVWRSDEPYRLAVIRPQWEGELGLIWPKLGLARVQWGGPWTKEGVPMRARYRKTHWVGLRYIEGGSYHIFDVNAVNDRAGCDGWLNRRVWHRELVPWLLNACVPKADGRWWFTHVLEVRGVQHPTSNIQHPIPQAGLLRSKDAAESEGAARTEGGGIAV